MLYLLFKIFVELQILGESSVMLPIQKKFAKGFPRNWLSVLQFESGAQQKTSLVQQRSPIKETTRSRHGRKLFMADLSEVDEGKIVLKCIM